MQKSWSWCAKEQPQYWYTRHRISGYRSAFPPEKARSLAKRLELHYTPKHGSWLNVAEIELSVLARQCLDTRIPDLQTLTNQVEAWKSDRNQKHRTVDWQFTTTDARIKLKKLYPKF